MARFLLKAFLFAAPLAVLAACPWIGARWKSDPLNNRLERRIAHYGLAGASGRLIAAGDSRAEFHVDPGLLGSLTGVPAANIGVPTCDLATLRKALAKAGLLRKGNVFLVSVSPRQLNDGAIDAGNVAPAFLMDLSFSEALRLYARDPDKALPAYQEIWRRVAADATVRLARALGLDATGAGGQGEGFEPLRGKSKETFAMESILRSKAFKDWKPDGVRRANLRASLEALGGTEASFLLYLSMRSPAWRRFTAGSPVEAAERQLSTVLAAEAARHPNMAYVDFHEAYRDSFPEAMFYDEGHLNEEGARRFTQALARILKEERPELLAEAAWARLRPEGLAVEEHGAVGTRPE